GEEVGHAVERAAEIARRLESSADLAPSIAIYGTLTLLVAGLIVRTRFRAISDASLTSFMTPKSRFKRTTPHGQHDGCAVASWMRAAKSTPAWHSMTSTATGTTGLSIWAMTQQSARWQSARLFAGRSDILSKPSASTNRRRRWHAAWGTR